MVEVLKQKRAWRCSLAQDSSFGMRQLKQETVEVVAFKKAWSCPLAQNSSFGMRQLEIVAGGFYAFGEIVISSSTLSISRSRSAEKGGGFATDSYLEVTNGSFVSLQNVTAGSHGGGFYALGEIVIAGSYISNSHAESGSGGGFDTEKGLKVSLLKTHHSECDSWRAWRRFLCLGRDCDCWELDDQHFQQSRWIRKLEEVLTLKRAWRCPPAQGSSFGMRQLEILEEVSMPVERLR